MVQPIINYYFYQPAQFLKPFRFASPLGWMFEVGKRADFQSWTMPTKCLFSAVATIGIVNEIFYFTFELLEEQPGKGICKIHEFQKAVTIAFLIHSLIHSYRTGSWSRALINASYQIPAIASCLSPNPTFPFVTRQVFNPPKSPLDKTVKQKLEVAMSVSAPIFLISNTRQKVYTFFNQYAHGSPIYTLSIDKLATCTDWRAQMLQLYQHLEGTNKVFLYIPDVYRCKRIVDQHVKDSLFIFFQEHREVPPNVKIILSSTPTMATSTDFSLAFTLEEQGTEDKALPDFVEDVEPSENKELRKLRKEVFGKFAEAMLATAHSTRPKHHIALASSCPDAQEEAILNLSDLIQEKELQIPIYLVDLSKIIDLKESLALLSPLLERGKKILVLQGIDTFLDITRSAEEFLPLPPQLSSELISFLQNPDLHIILNLSPQNLDYLFKKIPTFEAHYEPITLPPLPMPLKRKHFELAQAESTHLDKIENIWDRISSFVGLEAPLQDYLAAMGKIEGYMSLDPTTTFNQSLEKLKSQVSHNRKHSALPPNLAELTAIDEEVICLDRDADLEKMVTIMNSKSPKNNICFYGEAGCGKTQLARFFAQQIKAGQYPKFMGARVFSFKLSSIMADSMYIGQWQGKLKAIFDFLEPLYQSGEVVFLFIDEIHMAIGAGKSTGNQTMDIANMLKDYILHPNLRVIGATTPKEFSMYLTHDEAFMDRFTPYYLKPLTKANQLNALRAHSAKYSTDGTPLADQFLTNLLTQGLSLRSAEGILGQIHSYMELHPDQNPEDAAKWVLASS